MMNEFEDLTKEMQHVVVLLGKQWLAEHLFHVLRLVGGAKVAYPPSGSDCFHPELWKAEHWKWFADEKLTFKEAK
jgi:hypothetical protein